jgi:hypothetical protein
LVGEWFGVRSRLLGNGRESAAMDNMIKTDEETLRKELGRAFDHGLRAGFIFGGLAMLLIVVLVTNLWAAF